MRRKVLLLQPETDYSKEHWVESTFVKDCEDIDGNLYYLANHAITEPYGDPAYMTSEFYSADINKTWKEVD